MRTDQAPLFNFTPGERREFEATTLRLTAAMHIENYLEHLGLQAKDLAQRIRKSRPWVSKLLSGRQNTTLDTLAEVALALGARWNLDLVPAERVGTPAEADIPASAWIGGSTTSVTVTNVHALGVREWAPVAGTFGVLHTTTASAISASLRAPVTSESEWAETYNRLGWIGCMREGLGVRAFRETPQEGLRYSTNASVQVQSGAA